MGQLFSHPRFLVVYSGVLTFILVVITVLNLGHGWFKPMLVSGAEQDAHHVDFDQITVHRINIVEPDGTPRLIISDKAEFPGEFYKGKEIPRKDRQAAGMLFNNDEGTENGGLLFGGDKSSDGTLSSYGHLSFDEYEQDQTLSIDTVQSGDYRRTSYQINDNATSTLSTPDIIAAYAAVRSMPDGHEKEKARADLRAKYPLKLPARASLERQPDKSAALLLRDPEGRTRIQLRVAADGTPTMQFFDATGKVTHQWPETSIPSQPGNSR
jgi:hypothetical protein